MSVGIGIDHLTLPDVSPPDLVGVASAAGFDTVGLRVAPAGPREEPWPMGVGSPMLEETVGRLADTGVRVLAVETLQLHQGTRPGDYEPVLEIGAQLGARFVNLMIYDDDLDRVSEAFAAVTANGLAYGLRPLVEAITYMPVRNLKQAVPLVEFLAALPAGQRRGAVPAVAARAAGGRVRPACAPRGGTDSVGRGRP